MASSTTSSLQFLTLASSKTLSSISKTPTPTSLFFSPASLKPFPKLLSSNKLFEPTPSSRIIRTVAVSTGLEVDEELSSDGDDEQEQSFSPDLKIFVGNLPFSVDSAALAGLFESAGNVEMVEVIYDKVSGRSRGFGFVTMSSVEEVEEAVRKFNGYELDGRALRVNSGPPPPRREESSFGGQREGRGGGGRSFDNTNRVYVGNLAWSVDNLALETLFREQGNVLDAKVVYDRESGRSRGFGFVTYSSADEVNSAIDSLNGVDLDGRNIRVSVAEAPQRRQF
ncbi:putative RNA recognition motif domain, nucleotide-binding alpha-beta plait domain superfamily [Helianthus annuus]|nr:putative RNA recognition motif domain, nucleotide-binding alpha-beta plait domain superfamily [Helianthus annuus]KAJ0663460.1 putative RNA recognition motif domain, nucleotide-binding alpha-beta plait domain superfamily [Helianthus annuus]KAJ0670957.1 putative RNA recognition motif domain, nucleotide-binding alpha-beta plait domain superfamily [Helianthus annuus]KAJ0714526.1 putative RNA recognition motif domain, nucleotide-binding alpha-beta plait domain superfamily [Helianthus annuus]KAJ08